VARAFALLKECLGDPPFSNRPADEKATEAPP
jgi:hypothetical protein